MNKWMNKSIVEWMNEWLYGWMDGWMNEWMTIWMNEWMNGWMNEWMNEWMNDGMNEWTNDGMNEWMNEWWNEWMNEWWNEWMNDGMNEWMNKRTYDTRLMYVINASGYYHLNVLITLIVYECKSRILSRVEAHCVTKRRLQMPYFSTTNRQTCLCQLDLPLVFRTSGHLFTDITCIWYTNELNGILASIDI